MEKAVFTTGGKQYRVKVGDKLKIEKLLPSTGSGQAGYEVGATLTFDQVLMTENGASIELGQPTLSGAKVTAKILKIAKAPKVTVIKYQPKSRYFKKNGHRQPYFEVEITAVK